MWALFCSGGGAREVGKCTSIFGFLGPPHLLSESTTFLNARTVFFFCWQEHLYKGMPAPRVRWLSYLNGLENLEVLSLLRQWWNDKRLQILLSLSPLFSHPYYILCLSSTWTWQLQYVWLVSTVVKWRHLVNACLLCALVYFLVTLMMLQFFV
jgi:hypothetical protein